MKRLKQFGDIQARINEAILEKNQNIHEVHVETMKKIKAVLRIPLLTQKFHDLIRNEKMDEYDSLDLVFRKHFDLIAQQRDENTNSPARQPHLSKVQKHLVEVYRTPFTPPLSGSEPVTQVSSMNETKNVLASMNTTFKKLRNTMVNNRIDWVKSN